VTALFLLLACVQDNGAARSDRPTSFRVALSSGSAATPDEPNAFSNGGTAFSFDVQAIGADGAPVDWDGFVRVAALPGQLVSVGGDAAPNVHMTGGRVEGVSVVVALAYGDVRVWFEDVGYEPGEPGTALCGDGVDEDGDRRFDFPDDPGCFASNDESEEDGHGGVGVSEALWFANPTLAEVQGRTSRSPLDGASITVDRGRLVVTRVAVDGLYATDLDESSWGHIYLFNFSTPAGVRVCDGLTRVDGIVGEFFGYTELSFPSWEAVEWDDTEMCPVPEPTVLGAATLADADTMESLEASLVRVTNVTVGSPRSCDLDGDRSIDLADAAESGCVDACNADPTCYESTQFARYGQLAVALDAAVGPKVYVVASDTVPEFDPSAHTGERLPAVTGTLRQVEFLDPPWLIEPRCPDDLVVDGDPLPSSEACVERRTEPEDEP
jgi:hypothetical protein